MKNIPTYSSSGCVENVILQGHVKAANRLLDKKSKLDPRNAAWKAQLRLTSGEAFVGQNNHSKAIAFLQAVLNNPASSRLQVQSLMLLAKCEMAAKNFVSLQSLCARVLNIIPNHVEAMSLQAWAICLNAIPTLSPAPGFGIDLAPCHLQVALQNVHAVSAKDSIDGALDLWRTCQQLEPTVALHALRIGQVLWMLGGVYREDKSYCFAQFLASAKLDPNAPDPFAYLGHYYLAIENNVTAAVRCYQKALKLNAAHEEAGSALFSVLISQGLEVQAETMLQAAIEAPGTNATWAWWRMARLQKESKRYTLCIKSLQQLLRVDSTNARAWMELGTSYLKSGKFAAAVKSLNRAVELEASPEAITALAEAHVMTDRSLTALTLLKPLVHTAFVPALIVYTDALFVSARDATETGAFATARQYLDECVQSLLRVQLVWHCC